MIPFLQPRDALRVFLIFLKLGLTSFGGPIAHLGYFHEEFVRKRRWLDDRQFGDLVAICQTLPGPASSQIGLAVGLLRSGLVGMLAAWLGFTLPSAALLVLFAFGVSNFSSVLSAEALHGLKIAAVAVVAQALLTMSRNLCPDWKRRLLAFVAALIALFFPTTLGQISALIGSGTIALFWFSGFQRFPESPLRIPLTHRQGAFSLFLFAVLLLGLPALVGFSGSPALRVFDVFYRVGALVFGGGHVVLPLLKSEVMMPGWVDQDAFLAGYGAAQAVPGPLFTFAAYLGAILNVSPSGVWGAIVCLVGIFAPSFFLVCGVLPFWEKIRKEIRAQKALAGINAAVVGLLLAAFYDPILISGVRNPQDAILALVALFGLLFARAPSWLVVLFCATATSLFS